MKNIVVFVLLSIAFFSCRENQVASEQMDRAETLLPVYPDSAYVILEGVELPDKLNERQFAVGACCIAGRQTNYLKTCSTPNSSTAL